MISSWMLLAGVLLGAGATVIVRALVRDVPDLAAALARLDGTEPGAAEPTGGSPVRRWWLRTAPRWASGLGLDRCAAHLTLLDLTPADLLARKAGYGLLGVAFPPVMVAVMAVVGLTLPWPVPAVTGLVLGGVLFWVPDLDLRRRAAAAREELRRAVCVFLELVALERAADAGAVEALDRAAMVGDGRAFTLIRDALLRAQLQGTPPWTELDAVAVRIRVPDLGDVADIMRLSGEDGAAVYATLRARAAGLRTAILAQETAAANAASEHMVVPVALLGVAFLALLGYPALARLLTG